MFLREQEYKTMNHELSPLTANFGENIFSFEVMRDRLPREFYDKLMFAIRNQRPISPETADVIAQAMKEWAISRGTTHYTHWFQPLTGLTAEKHESFMTLDETGRTLDRFSGRELIMSEPDASSFPHGGLRSTFEARGYAAWDPSSPAFLMKRGDSATLCLPSVYVSFKGEVLDKKTPLLRSISAVGKSAVRMLRLLGNKRVTSVMPYLGAEQEYFLVDRDLFLERPDLREVGTTLMGAGPARGQQLEDHYFRAIGDRVLVFMEDVERELIRLGVPVKTRHNEVAPGQFELAVLHRPANIAADQNQLVMEMLRRVAPRHGFEALLHEKPFARVNGSGKHNNWSLIDTEGNNLLEPGTNPSSRLRFLVFLNAVILGVHRHGALLRAIVAGPGNELRLGGNEAPPAIISVHLGDHLTTLLDNLAQAAPEGFDDLEEIDLGLAGVARIPRDTTDRNRTSPFAFTGNKFEFRAVGSSAAVSLPNAVINAMVAEGLDLMSGQLKERLDSGESRNPAVLEVLRSVIQETAPTRFDGDNYTAQWNDEASKRGLAAVKSSPEALDALLDDSTYELFDRYGLMTRQENEARYRIWLDLYIKTVGVELKVARQMLATKVLPAAVHYQERLAGSISQLAAAMGSKSPAIATQRSHLEEVSTLVARLIEAIRTLERDDSELSGDLGELRDEGIFCSNKVRPHIAAAREIADRLEELVDDAEWPLPSYDDLLTL
jgi:glutamine synthetase